MEVFRITKQKYANDLSGKGAELFGGRWNPIGIPALYTSENRALATLELLVHTPRKLLPQSYVLLTIAIPESLELEIITLDAKQLSGDWNSLQAKEWTEEIGRKYFNELNALGIQVPSAIIKEEYNVVLNPLHPKYEQITIIDQSDIKIDQRLLK